jgi:16S rRNA (uracil1498-N3)-methyltransferase
MSAAPPPRIFVERSLAAEDRFELAPGPSRHVQVLRLQPGSALTLFDGRGGEWTAEVLRIGRSAVEVRVDAHVAIERELAGAVMLAIGMPANERMDALVEKATELGAAALQPLLCERSVLRLSGERAARRLEHWRGVAVAASEQCGRTRLPRLGEVLALEAWLESLGAPGPGSRRFVLSPQATLAWSPALAGPPGTGLVVLSGPEGGLSANEEAAARRVGFEPVSLGARILRADTAPLALLAACGFIDAPAKGGT